ncbi:MAG: hypothetical protein STSR0007_13310 [Thermovirga sp.]
MGLQNLKNCRICGKLYTHFRGPEACDDCRIQLEEVYKKARTILREAGPDEEYDNIRLADELGVEKVLIHILAEEGLFERDGIFFGGENAERKKLAKEFEAELKRKEDEKSARKVPGGSMFMDIRRKKND